MMKLLSKVVLFAGIVSVVACEKVIDVPLNEAEREIVVEAVGRNYLGESFVDLSLSGSVYDDSGFDRLSGAAVKITDKNGVESVFTEDPAVKGRYVSADFLTEAGNKYDLKVDYDGTTLTGSTNTMSKVEIDSLTYIQQIGGFGGGTDTTYLVFYNFTDPADEENYYRARAWVNGEGDNLFYLTGDELFNGYTYTAPFFGTSIESGDTVYVELVSMDEVQYTYLFTLANNGDAGPFSAAPANPVTNIDNGIGYFGGFMIDTMTIIIP